MNDRGLRVAVAVSVVLVAIWAGARLYVTQTSRHGGIPPTAGQAGAPDAGAVEAWPHPKIPARLPAFALSDLSGQPTPISRWSGKSLVINFWATWCAPCRREIPLLQTLATDWAARDVTVLGIAVDYRDKVRDFARELKIDYPLLIGEQDALDVAAQFGMDSPAFPFTVFTDQRGEVVALFVGELHRPQAELILSVVQNLNHNLVQLPEAKRSIADGLAAIQDNRAG